MKFQVIGRKSDGSTVYYTGRSGQAFISESSLEAFQFDTLEYARHRATVLNRMSTLHGILFIALCPEPPNSDVPNLTNTDTEHILRQRIAQLESKYQIAVSLLVDFADYSACRHANAFERRIYIEKMEELGENVRKFMAGRS